MLAEDGLKRDEAPASDISRDISGRVEDLIRMRLPEAEARRLLLALTPERITPELLTQLVETMRQTAEDIPAPDFDVTDCCGTGGSGLPHFNASTAAAFILAAGGVKVVKFGNRAASSASGSFDFLEALGIPAACELPRLPEMLDRSGLVFLFAPQCYPALAPLAKLRREIGVRTVFNFLGPLLNPVHPAYRLLGVSDAHMQALMAEHLARHLPPKRAWLVHAPIEGASSGLDEIAASGETRVLEVKVSKVLEKYLFLDNNTSRIQATAFSYTPAENARIFNAIITGEDKASECYRMLCINAGAGLHVAGKAESLAAGAALAEELLASGRVRETLRQCREGYGGQTG